MAKTKLKVKDIITFIEKEGGREVTDADKKTDWYKFAFKKVPCFKTNPPRKSGIKA
ncbi:MAG: hypothetical protein HQL08_11355 [Nitrospirae bacterium]|nr:hypothetical protein [Nitrospirota bacterium]